MYGVKRDIPAIAERHNNSYRERKGRGRTYGTNTLENVRRIWESVGCPCTTYFVAELPRIVREYEECVALIKPKNQPSAIGCTSYLTNRILKSKQVRGGISVATAKPSEKFYAGRGNERRAIPKTTCRRPAPPWTRERPAIPIKPRTLISRKSGLNFSIPPNDRPKRKRIVPRLSTLSRICQGVRPFTSCA